MKDVTRHTELVALLHKVEGFQALAADVLEKIADVAEYQDVSRGTVLIAQGAPADTLYIVLKGRFTVLASDRPIAEIAMGEPIGELAFFAGGTRTASVIAARDSVVLSLTRTAYDALAEETPALTHGILAAVAQRLARAVPASPKLRPRAGKICSVLPAGDGPIDPAFLTGLAAAFDGIAGWHLRTPDACPADQRADVGQMRAWLETQEAELGNIVLVCADPVADPVWHQVTVNNSDTVMLVQPKPPGLRTPPASSAPEERVYAACLPEHLHMVFCRPRAGDPTQHTRAWLEGRPVGTHHHLAMDSPDDFARLARFIRGEALGLVLCGGGSYGTAHLGVLKALQENGYAFDFVGGTSVGSAMAAAMAIGLAPDDIMEQCEDIFIRSKAMSRLTVPRLSLLDHHRLDSAFKRHYGAYDVEDLPINFYAVSTSLTANDVRVIRSGPLWQAVRASTAIPGIFPPFLRSDGEVLIDGGLMDNVPLDEMRDLKPGPNVVLNFLSAKPWRVFAKYEDLPTRIEAFGGLLRKPKHGVHRHPTAFAVLARAMVVNARKLLRQVDVGSDVLFNINVLKGMSFMDWKRGRELFETTHADMRAALDATPADAADQAAQIARLRVVAAAINAKDDGAPVHATASNRPDQPRLDTITEPTE